MVCGLDGSSASDSRGVCTQREPRGEESVLAEEMEQTARKGLSVTVDKASETKLQEDESQGRRRPQSAERRESGYRPEFTLTRNYATRAGPELQTLMQSILVVSKMILRLLKVQDRYQIPFYVLLCCLDSFFANIQTRPILWLTFERLRVCERERESCSIVVIAEPEVLPVSSLQCTPWGIMASLEQHVAQLKVNAEVKLADFPTVLDESQPPAETARSLSAPNGTTDIEPRDTWLSDLARSTLFADALAELKSLEQGQEGNQQAQKAETYIFGLIQRKALPPRPSKPRTSLAPDARAAGVVRQSSLCRKEDQHSPKQPPVQVIAEVPVLVQSQVPDRIPPLAAHNLEQFQGTVYIDEPPPPYHHLPPNVQHQSDSYQKPKQVPVVANRSISLEYPSCRVIPTQVDSSNSEPDSPQNFQGNFSAAVPKPQQLHPPEEHLVNAEYIPAQPCRASTRAYSNHPHHHHNGGKSSGAAKPNRSTYSPERTHHHQEQQPTQSQQSRSRSNTKKCDKNGAARKQGKKASRSQSENSLQRVPEKKYSTVERDGAGSGSGSRGSRGSQSKSKKHGNGNQHGNGNYRRWQSSLELSQDETEQPHGQSHAQAHPNPNQREQCSKRARKSRPTHPSYAYATPNHHHHHHHSHHHHQHLEYQLDSRPVEDYHHHHHHPHAAQGESESSTSEADSPDSSSLSSDSDESGGLVWPQQLPPQLSHPPPAAAAAAAATSGGPLQQKAFVKIKASHALKKKILRFRTGSLKVMTTV
ncbi:hypothetical protein WMY93_007756 [Mugilogobius chulae]|uniref:Uncharacterized protein n=1 Tax=Mugilogobius chulae TaxID=88201 RepID=A0AAW0PF86_9GOBI